MVVFLLLVIVAMVLGIIGVVADGLGYLLTVGIVVFIAALALLGLHMRQKRLRRPTR